MVLSELHTALFCYDSLPTQFPLTRKHRVFYRLNRLAHDETQPKERRESFRVMQHQLLQLEVPCRSFYPKACKHSALLAQNSGTLTGVFLALGMHLWAIAWPLSYLSCWLAEKVGACWSSQHAAPMTRALRRAESAWQAELTAQQVPDPSQMGTGNLRSFLQDEADSRMQHLDARTQCATIEVLASRSSVANGQSFQACARARVYTGLGDTYNTACLRFFSGNGVGRRPRELIDAHDWLGQIAVSLRALRFPRDVSQARAAIKAGSDFAWVEKLNVTSLSRDHGPYEAEGVAIVAHAGQVFVANAGRCRTFAVGHDSVRQLSVKHTRDLVSEQERATLTEKWLGPGRPFTRALSTVANQKCFRPQVTAVPSAELLGASIISVTPGVVEFLGPRAYQAMMFENAREELSVAPQKLAESIVAAGYAECFSLLVFRFPTEIGRGP